MAVNFYTDISLGDSNKLLLGGGSDLQISHDGSNSYINNFTGNLAIRNNTDDGDIVFQSDNGLGGIATYFKLDGSLVNGTTTLGAVNFPDKSKLFFGTDSDLRIYHDGDHSYISEVGTGDLRLSGNNLRMQNSDNSANYIKANNGSNVELYFNGNKKFETTSTGVEVTGDITADSFVKDGGTSSQYLMADGSVSTGGGGSSPWSTDTNGITYTAGNVGIGTASDNNVDLLVGSNGIEALGGMKVGGSTRLDGALYLNDALYDNNSQGGTIGQVLTRGISGINWATPTTGGSLSIASTANSVFSASSNTLGAIDAGSDKIVFWDNSAGSAGELKYLTLGTNLSITGTVLNAAGGSGGSSPWSTDIAGIYYNDYIGVGSGANTNQNISVGSKGIRSVGPIGVGISPLAPGHFTTNTSSAAQPTLILENTNSTSGSDTFITFIKEEGTTDTMWHAGADGQSKDFRFVKGTGASPKNFGTGTEALRFNFNDVSATFSDDVYADNFILNSDERLKENIEDVDYSKHIKADWKTFNFKKDKEDKRHGVIAQELEVHHPEFVNTDEEGYKSVQYIDLLIAKIAELEARLEKLEK